MPAGLNSAATNWEAELRLGFARRGVRTVIARRNQRGPLAVQRPFYPEGHVCHTYVLHPPGGVVGGDQLSLIIDVAQHAHALVTTPASTKFYRSHVDLAVQNQHMQVMENAILEWFPQDMILFSGCNVRTRSVVNLAGNAKFAGWEILCQGRPASGEHFDHGECRQQLEVYRDSKPLLIERTSLQGNSYFQQAKWGLAGYPVNGTMLVTGANRELLSLAREVTQTADVLFSATLLGDVLLCRYLGRQGIEAREQLTRVWESLREAWIGLAPCPPRIWNT